MVLLWGLRDELEGDLPQLWEGPEKLEGKTRVEMVGVPQPSPGPQQGTRIDCQFSQGRPSLERMSHPRKGHAQKPTKCYMPQHRSGEQNALVKETGENG